MADTFPALAGDGMVRNLTSGAAWATTIGAGSGTDKYDTLTGTSLVYNDVDYCGRGYLSFDTGSLLPDGAVPTSAKIQIMPTSGQIYTTDAAQELCVVAATPASTSSLALSDFSQVGSTELAARVKFTDLTAGVLNDITLNSAGLSHINTTGVTKFGFRGTRDLLGTTPTGPSGVGISYSEHATSGNRPVLIVEYTVAVAGSDSGAVTEGSVALPAIGAPIANIADSFTAPNGTDIAARTPEQGLWTPFYHPGSSALKITSNRAYCYDAGGGGSTVEYRHSDSFADGYIEGDWVVVGSGGYGILSLRSTGANAGAHNNYRVIFDHGGFATDGNIVLQKLVSGAPTTLQTYSTGAGFSGTHRVRLQAVGTAITVLLDGNPVISVTDSSVTGSGQTTVQIYSTDGTSTTVGVHLDNLVIASAAALGRETTAVTDSASVNTGTTSKSGSETGAATDAAAVTAALLPSLGAARAVRSGPATIFAGAGTPGTFGAHYAFPMWTRCANGDIYAVARKASTHASSDGILVGKRCPAGLDPGVTGNWGSEDVLTVNSATLDDRPGGAMKTLASGRVVMVWQRWNNLLTSPTRQHTAWFAYSDDHCVTWSTPVQITTGHYATIACPSDIVEMGNGDLLCVTYGCPTNDINGPWDVRLSKSTAASGGATWTDFGQVVAGSSIAGQVLSEPSLVLLDSGPLLLTFADVGSVGQPVYKMQSTGSHDGSTWGTPSLFLSSMVNRNAVIQTADLDVILGGASASGATAKFWTSTDRGVTFDSGATVAAAVSPLSSPVWTSPGRLAAAGITPNVGIAWSYEKSTQDLASVYFQTYTSPAGMAESVTVAEGASVGVLSSAVPKTAADTAAATDAASVAALTPVAKTGAETAAGTDTSDVTEIDAPVVIAAGTYDLRLGRIRLPTLLDQQKERVGEQLETVGATVVAGERRAKGMPLTIPIHATGADGKSVADRMRRQVRALVENPAARMGAIYLAFTPDPELSAWLLIGDGDLGYAPGGIVFGDYELALSDAYVVARQRSHLPARRIEVQDRRLATTPRDTKGLIYGTAFASVTPSPVAFLPGATRYLRNGVPDQGTAVASVAALMGTGTPQLLTTLADGDVIVLDGIPDDAQLQAAELGDVIVLDRQGVAATTVTPARDITPQSSYGWEELYGPNQPISYPAGTPSDLVVQNGVCRITCASNGVLTIERMTSSGFTAACTVTALNPLSSTFYLRDANIVHWTPDETVVRFQLDNSQASPAAEAIGRCELYVTLRRGWDAPRVEAYRHLPAGTTASAGTVRLRVMHAIAGTTALATSTTGASNIADGTAYGDFSSRNPWLGLTPSSGPVILAAVTRTTDKIAGKVVGSLRGVEVYDDSVATTVSYASVQLSITTAGAASVYGPVHAQRCMADVRTIPTFLPR